MNNPAYSGSRIASPTNAHADPGCIRIHALPVAALVASMLLVTGHPPASAVTKTVCPQGCQYVTIAAAAGSINPGDTILVSAGTYPERVTMNGRAGTQFSPAVIKAVGTVIVDGRGAYTGGSWQQLDGTSVYYSSFTTDAPDKSQVFVGDLRYVYIPPPTSFGSLQQGQYAYDAGNSLLYVNAGGGPPVITISTRDQGFAFDSTNDYINLEGFTVLGFKSEGIRLRGTAGNLIQSVTVSGDTSKLNARRGIHLEYASNCSILHSTAHHNGGHGIYLIHSASCAISSNESFANDNPVETRGGIAGIKVGESSVSTDVSDVTVDYNIVHDNEDTGIDLNGAQSILVRRNVSYRNRDHGYDNNVTDQTTFLNNVAVRNDHDGMSIENTATNVSIYNCIFAGNAINPLTLQDPGNVRELFVDGPNGFASDYNIIVGSDQATGPLGGGYGRYLVEFRSGTLHQYPTWESYRQGEPNYDSHSYSSDPMILDTTGAVVDFRIGDSDSDALDAAKSDLTGWLATDPRGLAPHDVAGVANAGSGTPAYVDIGAFEFDVPPAAIADLTFDVDPEDCTKFWLSWTAPSDDVDLPASGRGTLYEMKTSSQPFTTWTGGSGTPFGLTPNMPDTVQTWPVSVGFGQHRYVGIGTEDANGQWSDHSNVVYISGPPGGWTDCSEGGGTYAGGGDGGDGYRARPVTGPAGEESAIATGFAENTLLNGVATGAQATDLFRLPALSASGGNAYSVRIREASGHAVALDRVRLLTVDHSSSVRTFMASGQVVLGTRMAPVHAEDATGRDLTARVDGSTTDAFKGDSGAVLTVKFATEPADSADPLVIEASGLGWSSSGILVQVPDEANGWRTVGRVQPRLYVDELAVDSIASTQVRLYFLGRHDVRFVGRVVRSTERPTLQWAQLLKADAARVGDALAAVTSADTTALALAGPDTLRLAFASPALAADQVRECFLAVDATPPALASPVASLFSARAVPSLPARFALGQNQPNPFSASTVVRFDLPVGAMVRLEVFDAQGRRVEVLANRYFPAGEHVVQWNPSASQSRIGPGVYFYRVEAGSFRDRKKMALLP